MLGLAGGLGSISGGICPPLLHSVLQCGGDIAGGLAEPPNYTHFCYKANRDAADGHHGELVGSRCLAEVGGMISQPFLQTCLCYLADKGLILPLPCPASLRAPGNAPMTAWAKNQAPWPFGHSSACRVGKFVVRLCQAAPREQPLPKWVNDLCD